MAITTSEKSSIDEAFNHYWQLLAPNQKQSVLAMLKTFVVEDEMPGKVFLDDYNNDIDEALQEYSRGEYVTHEEIVKKYLAPNA